MKKLIVCLLAQTLFLTGYAQSFKMTIVFENAKDGTVMEIVPRCHDTKVQPIATAVIKKGKCTFKGNMPVAEAMCVSLRMKDDSGQTHFMLQPGDDIHAVCSFQFKERIKNKDREYDRYVLNLKIEDSPLTDEYNKISEERIAIRKQFEEKRSKLFERFKDYLETLEKTNGNKEEANKVRESFEGKLFRYGDDLIYKEFMIVDSIFLDKYSNTLWAPIVMTDLWWYFTPSERPYYEKWPDEVKNTWLGKKIKEELYPAGKAGEIAPNFRIKDEQGLSHSFASLAKNKKVVLVDFWASWCGPCRKEIPNVKKQYELYKDKGFEVVSISIDKDENAWKKALDEEQLPWPNFLDREGVSDLYHVKSIPAMYLLKPDGTIIAEGMDARGEALSKRLSSMLKS